MTCPGPQTLYCRCLKLCEGFYSVQDGLPHLTDLARSKNTPGDMWLSDSTAEELGVLRRDLRDGGIRSDHDGNYTSPAESGNSRGNAGMASESGEVGVAEAFVYLKNF